MYAYFMTGDNCVCGRSNFIPQVIHDVEYSGVLVV